MATDNDNLEAKLSLRSHFLESYHSDGLARVFDCCQASGRIWRTLQNRHRIARYWGVDLKHKPGRLRVDSQRILQQPGWNDNVIDIDTYGEPWAHWMAVLSNAAESTTVFLTIGRSNGLAATSNLVKQILGIKFSQNVPTLILTKAEDLIIENMLAQANANDGRWVIREAQEAKAGKNARYIGIRLDKQQQTRHIDGGREGKRG
jgi:hypothetical protein